MLRRTLATVESASVAMGMAGSSSSLYLLLGATGVGKSLLVKRLQNILRRVPTTKGEAGLVGQRQTKSSRAWRGREKERSGEML